MDSDCHGHGKKRQFSHTGLCVLVQCRNEMMLLSLCILWKLSNDAVAPFCVVSYKFLLCDESIVFTCTIQEYSVLGIHYWLDYMVCIINIYLFASSFIYVFRRFCPIFHIRILGSSGVRLWFAVRQLAFKGCFDLYLYFAELRKVICYQEEHRKELCKVLDDMWVWLWPLITESKGHSYR